MDNCEKKKKKEGKNVIKFNYRVNSKQGEVQTERGKKRNEKIKKLLPARATGGGQVTNQNTEGGKDTG